MYPFNREKSVTHVTLHGSRSLREHDPKRDPKLHALQVISKRSV